MKMMRVKDKQRMVRMWSAMVWWVALLSVLSYVRVVARSLHIQRVCIIGGGISGLTLSNALQTLASTDVTSIDLYDARDKSTLLSTQIGGGVQLTGGANILDLLNMKPRFTSLANKVSKVKCVNYNNDLLYELNVRDALNEAGLDTGYTIMRDSLISLLYDQTQANNDKVKVNVFPSYRCTNINEVGNKVVVQFDGKESKEYDLVVGCDGVSSSVRKAIEVRDIFNNDVDQRSLSPFRITYCVTPPCKDGMRENSIVNEMHQFMG